MYTWQEECLKRWMSNGGRGIVQAVTGSGKTRLSLEGIKEIEKRTGAPVLVKIVVPTAALMRQWSRALQEASAKKNTIRMEIGMRGGGQRCSEECKYMIYVINSARYELAREILADLQQGAQVLLIADECHRYASEENQHIFEFLPYIKEYENRFFSMGLSATLPEGQARRILSYGLGKCVYGYEMKQALEAQTVCGCDVFHVGISLLPHEKQQYEKITEHMRCLYGKLLTFCPGIRGKNRKELYEMLRLIADDKKSQQAKNAALYMKLAFQRKNLVCLAEARNTCAVHLIRLLDSARKIIVFGERICQAEELYRMLQKYFPGKTGCYHSKMGNQANRNTLERFRNNEIRILITCKSLDEGIDIRDASVGIVLSGTSAQRQRIQRLGRIIRRTDGKSRASLYYLHAEEISEDACFLPDMETGRIFELEYHCSAAQGKGREGYFYAEEYTQRAEKLLAQFERKEISDEVRLELLRCLEWGSVRADWRLPEEEIGRCLERAESIQDKNYWICMGRIHMA